jgi:hypothetical protein
VAIVDEADEADQPRRLDRHGAIGAFDWGVLATAGVALAYGILTYPIGLTWGLIAAGVVGGWVIGRAVARGAWGGSDAEPHAPDRRVRAWAAALGLLAWVGGLLVAYAASGLLFPEAHIPLTERISFLDYLVETYSFQHSASALALALIAWRSAG